MKKTQNMKIKSQKFNTGLKIPKWQHANYWFKTDSFINDLKIYLSLKNFWKEYLAKVKKKKDIYFNILFKCYINNFDGFRSISLKFRACKKDFDEMFNYCKESWNIKSAEYKNSLCSGIAFAYREIPKK